MTYDEPTPEPAAPRPNRWGSPSRRAFLRGLLASSIGLPWLESLRVSESRAQVEVPRCFIAMFSANGTVYDQWLPSGSETDFELSPILAPLEPHRSDLVIVEGLTQQGAGGDAHQSGIGGMLTGARLLPGRFAGQTSAPAGWAAGPSVDQRIAAEISREAPFRSLELGVQTGAADNWGRMIYRDRNQPLAPREDPARVFDDVFGYALLDPTERERIRARRASILDYVNSEFSALAAEVSSSDRQRLESHLTQLREVERRLDHQATASATCELPALPPSVESVNDAFPETGELMLDLLAVALGCGRTNVASLQWSRSVSQVRFTWLGIDQSHHELSHLPDSNVEAQDKLTRINTWYAERFAGLIQRLKTYQVGDGTLFDQCLLLWSSELGKGNTHSHERAPYVLAGSAAGALATGRFLRYPGATPHNNLLVSLLNVMGLETETFGDPEWCTGPLDGML